MLFKSLLTVLTLAASVIAAPTTTHTTGYAIVVNNLDQDLWVWSVDSQPHGPKLLPKKTRAGSAYTESYRYDPATGIAIKIATKEDGLYSGGGVLQLAYTLNDKENSIYYDLSAVNQLDDFVKNNKLTVTGSPGTDAPTIVWDHVQTPPKPDTKAYHGDTVDLTLTIGS
ncbi:hypothetical protein BDV96DRAFT_599044 [Lophiotrema nucula]|uniref:Bys1 family protein n=1 Tax=Lophiotrema nucula TaxID=690887 RepID=A0A6A5ZA13_9PLEO|nr:hypothetical protein BDV96DRAFT_599044 [Lophiotrema nucula]